MCPKIIGVLGVLFVVLPLVCGAGTPGAARAADEKKDDKAGKLISGVAEGGAKYLAVVAFKAAASEIYKSECGSPEDDAQQLICGALRSFSGEAEKEWKANVTNQLAAIRDDLADLKKGQLQLRQGIDTLIARNDVLLAEINKVVSETVAEIGLRQIQALWDEQFESIFEGTASFSQDRLLSFADQIVKVQQMHTKLGVIAETMSTKSIKPPLLESWAQSIQAKLKESEGEADLNVAYAFLEQSFADVLFEQQKGYLMYVWAAEILDSECAIKPDGCRRPPMSAQDFEGVFTKLVVKQIEAFNHSVEWLVLANSYVHGMSADFLHPDGLDVFRRVDLFSAANLGTSGLRGRVISMGDQFDGKLQFTTQLSKKELRLTPVATAQVAIEGGAPLDWWRATDPKSPQVYDEVRFANTWRIFRYQQKGDVEFDVALFKEPELPVSPAARVIIWPIDLRTGEAAKAPITSPETVKLFGSFTAIERVGGGYALTSGGYDATLPAPEVETNAALKNAWRKNVGPQACFGRLCAGVATHARIEYHALKTEPEYQKETVKALLRTKKRIRYVPGGRLMLNIVPGSGAPVAWESGGYTTDFAPDRVAVGLKTTYHKPVQGRQSPAELEGKAALVFGDAGSKNGFVHHKKLTQNSQTVQNLQWAAGSTPVTLEKGKAYPLTLETWVSISQMPSGYDASEFWALAEGRFRDVYLSKN